MCVCMEQEATPYLNDSKSFVGDPRQATQCSNINFIHLNVEGSSFPRLEQGRPFSLFKCPQRLLKRGFFLFFRGICCVVNTTGK